MMSVPSSTATRELKNSMRSFQGDSPKDRGQVRMEASPSFSMSGTRARTALLATTSGGSGSSGADRRVVFLASQRSQGTSHETRTWPHHWSPHMTEQDHKSVETSPSQTKSKIRLSRGQSNCSDEPSNSNSTLRQCGNRQTTETVLETECHTTSWNKGLRIGVYGWRKRCLYFLILGLTIIVILNLSLTLWLLKVMEFSFEGIGSLKVIPGGIELKGQAAILDALIASSVKSRRGTNLMLESWTNFTASARGDNGQVLARFTLSEDNLECVSKAFRITDPNGELIFSANNERVIVGAKTLQITGDGGVVIDGSIQTTLINSKPARDLRLESATRSLEVRAPQRINIESSAGDISASCLTHMKLTSHEGSVTIESRSVFLKGLRAGVLQNHGSSTKLSGKRQSNANKSEGIAVYQLCACADGKLFLAPAEGICQADKSIC